jgi:hypothetical protein
MEQFILLQLAYEIGFLVNTVQLVGTSEIERLSYCPLRGGINGL